VILSLSPVELGDAMRRLPYALLKAIVFMLRNSLLCTWLILYLITFLMLFFLNLFCSQLFSGQSTGDLIADTFLGWKTLRTIKKYEAEKYNWQCKMRVFDFIFYWAYRLIIAIRLPNN
jgi:hypothetical protein